MKLRTRPLHEVIENHEELAAHFHGTRYAGFFERHVFSSEHG